MIDITHGKKLRSCAPRQTQPATFGPQNATDPATDAQQTTLKALAQAVLERNKGRNSGATPSATGRNSGATQAENTCNQGAPQQVVAQLRSCVPLGPQPATGPAWRWHLSFPNGRTMTVHYSPSADRTEVESDAARWHGKGIVVSAMPDHDEPTLTDKPLTRIQETSIRQWLAIIGETNPDEIEAVIHQCRTDAEARRYFLQQHIEDMNNVSDY